MNLDQLKESPWGRGHQTVEFKQMVLGAHLMVTSTASVYSVIYSEEVEGSSQSSSSHVCTCPHKHTHTFSEDHWRTRQSGGRSPQVDTWEHKGAVM